MGKLTSLRVRAARHPDGNRPVRVGDGEGLYLQVAPGGSKSWLFRYTLCGRAREMGLGAVALNTAEEQAGSAASRCGPRSGARGEGAAAEGHGPHRRPARRSTRLRCRRAGPHVPVRGGLVHRGARDRLEAAVPGPQPGGAGGLRVPSFRGPSGGRGWHRRGDGGARTHLADESRDGHPAPRPDRGGAGLRRLPRVAAGREPGPVARAPGESSTFTRPGGEGGASCCPALARCGRLPGRAAPACVGTPRVPWSCRS